MKGNKDGKGDGSIHRSGGGVGSSAHGVETGALFPRLHVKETKKVGPRAPPRNKMALYEQFSFPSHRFVSPSVPLPTAGRPAAPTPYAPHGVPTGEKMALYEQFTFQSHLYAPPSASLPSSGQFSGSSSTVLQSSSHDGSRYFGPPPYGSISLPYMAMNAPHHGGQSFANGSGSSTVVDGESDMEPTSAGPADCGGHSSREAGHASPRHSNANVRSTTSRKGRANDDCTVPVYTAPKASTGFPKVYTEGSDWSSRGPWQSGMDITKAYQSIPFSSEYQVESSRPVSQRGESREDSVTGVTGENIRTEVSAKIVYSERGVAQQIDSPEGLSGEAHKEKQVSYMRSRYAQHADFRDHGAEHCDQLHRRKNKQYFDDTSEVEGLRSCGTGNGECLTVVEDDEDFGLKHRKGSSKAKPVKDSDLTDSAYDYPQAATQGKNQKRVESEKESARKQSVSTECRSNTAGSSDEDVDNPVDGEVSRHTQPNLWSDSEESDATMVEAVSSHKITPKDLINAVGQQGFWTARKLLQRQQMIFSTQVFELHRLIKVQQLLAAPDEDDEGDQAASPSPVDCPPEKVQAKKTMPEKQGSGHGGEDHEKNKRVLGQQPDSTCQSSSSKRVCVQSSTLDPQCGPENAAPAPVSHSAGTSGAWGCPPFVKPGASGWYGAMPAFNSAYMYQPYPGSYPQPAVHGMDAFSGSYRPLMCASPTPMDAMGSYGMPGYEARPDMMQDMYRYNAMQQQWQAAVYCNSVAQEPNASWYSAPPMPYMDPVQRMPSRWYDDMATSLPPAHLGFHRPTHQSNNPLMPTAQPMLYPMHPQWTDPALCQPQARDGNRFRAHTSWPMPGGSCQSSDQGFQRFVVSTAQESAASGSQVADGGRGKTWQGSEGKSLQDSDDGVAEVPAAAEYSNGDAPESSRSQKRSRENVAEGRISTDRDRQKNFAEETTPAGARVDALPLFPLVPVSNGGEKLKSNHSFPGVIKVVPRAMVATAESAAEILLSIQKQRKQ